MRVAVGRFKREGLRIWREQLFKSKRRSQSARYANVIFIYIFIDYYLHGVARTFGAGSRKVGQGDVRDLPFCPQCFHT